MNTFPDFWVIGAQKCGTTTLYEDLRLHTSVELAAKESSVLIGAGLTSTDLHRRYEKTFEKTPDGGIRGEVSTRYAMLPSSPGVPEAAVSVAPDARIVYLVREPLARVISHHHHDFTLGLTGPDIDEAVYTHPPLIDNTRYATQVEPWMTAFGKDRVLVVRFEDYMSDRAAGLADILAFIGAPEHETIDPGDVAHNAAETKHVAIGRWRRISQSSLYRDVVRPLMPEVIRRRVNQVVLPKAPHATESAFRCDSPPLSRGAAPRGRASRRVDCPRQLVGSGSIAYPLCRALMRSGRSIGSGFLWNFTGNSLYSLAQWLMLVLLARLADETLVGTFALMLAIAAPVFMTTGMNLRIVQASDAVSRWRLEDYLLLRHILNVVAVVVTTLVGVAIGMDGAVLIALTVLCVAKSVEAVSQTYYGFFQQGEHHDFVAQSMLVRSFTGPVLFGIGYGMFGDLAAACAGLLLGWIIPQHLLDRRRVRWLRAEMGLVIGPLLPPRWSELRGLARKAWPLGLDQGVSSMSVNTPRYFVQAELGAAQLGVYSALSYLSQVVSMITSALGIVVVPRLAKYHRDGKRREFIKLVSSQTVFSLLVVMVTVVAAVFFGELFVQTLLGRGFVNQTLLLTLLGSSGMITLQRCLGRGLVGAQRFATFLTIDLITAGGVAVASWVLIPEWGMIGAAWATSAGYAIGAVACLVPLTMVARGIAAPSDQLPR